MPEYFKYFTDTRSFANSSTTTNSNYYFVYSSTYPLDWTDTFSNTPSINPKKRFWQDEDREPTEEEKILLLEMIDAKR